MKRLKIIAAATVLFLSALGAAPIPAVDVAVAFSDPHHPGSPYGNPFVFPPPHQMDLAAGSPLYLPLVSKGSPSIPPGVLVVLISQFLLFVPSAGF